MDFPQDNDHKPSNQQDAKVVAGGDFSLSGRLADLRIRLGAAEHRALLIAGLVLLAAIIAAGLIFGMRKLKPVAVVDKPAAQHTQQSQGTDVNGSKNGPSNTTTPSGQPSTNPTTKPSGGGSSGGGTTTGGGSTSGSCSGAAHHVAGGPDGTGSCWPGPNNTGVPAGTTLTNYTGPCDITTANTVIDSKTINCSDGMGILAANVTIKNSKVNTYIALDTDRPGGINFSLTLQDSEVNANGSLQSAVGGANFTIIRANIYGAINGMECDPPMSYCTMRDSYIHGQVYKDNIDTHLGGILSDGGPNLTIVHNAVVCDTKVNNVGGGCTGDINLIPNFAAINGALIEHNLLGANVDASYCTYGGEKSSSATPHSYNIVYKDNIFQRGTNNQCAAYGPVTGFNINNSGNQWSNNTWDNGGAVPPAN